MTVKQLQKILNKMPQDAEVVYYDGDNGLCYVTEVEHHTEIIVNPWAKKPQTKSVNVVWLSYD